MTIEFNLQLIGERGGNLCGDDRFSIQSCEYCQGQYLYNAELCDVYYDAEDLTRHFFKIAGIKLPPCRYCGALNWQFSSLCVDQISVQTGPWAWALQSRSFTFN